MAARRLSAMREPMLSPLSLVPAVETSLKISFKLRWAKTRVLKTDTRVEIVFVQLLSNGRQRVGVF